MNRKKGKSSQKRVAASSETTSSTSSSNNLDIPGFYYDEVKKRYFKIQPNYATQSSVVTNDIIKERKHNQKILKTRFKIENILLSVFKNELGATKELYQTFNDQIISRLDVKSKIEFDDLKGIQYMSVFDSEYESNFAYVCLSYLDYHQQPFDVRIIKVNKALSHLRTERVSFKAQDIYYDEKQSNSGAYVHDNRYLVTTRANFNQSFVQIVKLTQSSQYTNILIETQIADFNVKNTLWSSCLNSNEKLNYSLTKCALGFADCGQVRDIYDSRKRFHLNSLSSDVFSIKFHTIDTETLVYVGCRNKFIFGNDLRIDNKRNQSFTSKLKHESSVTSMVFPYENSNLLYSTDYSGLVCLIDSY